MFLGLIPHIRALRVFLHREVRVARVQRSSVARRTPSRPTRRRPPCTARWTPTSTTCAWPRRTSAAATTAPAWTWLPACWRCRPGARTCGSCARRATRRWWALAASASYPAGRAVIGDAMGFQNDLFSAVSDLRSVNRLQQDSTDGYFRLAELLYRMGHVSDALKVTLYYSICGVSGWWFELIEPGDADGGMRRTPFLLFPVLLALFSLSTNGKIKSYINFFICPYWHREF